MADDRSKKQPAKGGTQTVSKRMDRSSGRSSNTSARQSGKEPMSSAARSAARVAARRKRRKNRVEEEPQPETSADLIKRMQASASQKIEDEKNDILEEEQRKEDEKAQRKKEKKREKAKTLSLIKKEDQAEERMRLAEIAASRGQSLRLNREDVEAGSERRKAAEAEKKGRLPKATRWVFRFVAFIFFVALTWLIYHSIKTNSAPDVVSSEGRSKLMGELTNDVTDFSSFVAADLEEMILGKPPVTKEQVAALVDESKKELEENAKEDDSEAPEVEKAKVEPKPAPAARVAAKPKPKVRPRKTKRPSYRSKRTRSRKSKKKKSSARIASAKRLYDQAISHYIKADPRLVSIKGAQPYIKAAKPIFLKCLAECERLRSSGKGGYDLDQLEQRAAMRLYDCNKRMLF